MASPPVPRLTYSISPATADTSTTTPQTIKITATSDNQDTSITSLTCTLPKGTSENDLTEEDLTNSNIKVTQGWQTETTTTNNICKIELTPEDDHPITLQQGQSLTLTLTLTPTKKAGTATLTITETTNAGGKQQEATTTRTFTKTGGAYSLTYFAPEHINVAYNGETTLHWEASGIANYTLNYDNEHITITNGEQKSYPIKNITHPTSYSLQANPKKPIPGATNPTLTTTITVDHPDITTNNLTITGTAKIARTDMLKLITAQCIMYISKKASINDVIAFAVEFKNSDEGFIAVSADLENLPSIFKAKDGRLLPSIYTVSLLGPSGKNEETWDPALGPVATFLDPNRTLVLTPTQEAVKKVINEYKPASYSYPVVTKFRLGWRGFGKKAKLECRTCKFIGTPDFINWTEVHDGDRLCPI
ncbi:hypothetical protein [Streptomyces wuyuanensis]|uniref:hypothetical protein n=1 Tax=Streptomyces wuyuanensis TaxID=1196353 RepID=UPI00342A3DC5